MKDDQHSEQDVQETEGNDHEDQHGDQDQDQEAKREDAQIVAAEGVGGPKCAKGLLPLNRRSSGQGSCHPKPTAPGKSLIRWLVALVADLKKSKVCALAFDSCDMKLPREVYDRLYEYQRKGVAWMWNLYQKRHSLLALSFLEARLGRHLGRRDGFGEDRADRDLFGLPEVHRARTEARERSPVLKGDRFLVVVPVTLLGQWRRELDSWAPWQDEHVASG